MNRIEIVLMVVGAFFFMGCERSASESSSGGQTASSNKAKDEPTSAPKPSVGKGQGHGGEVIDLGTRTIDRFSVRASRDKGEIKPGGDAPIDVWIDGGLGQGVSVVRFWIGAPDAKGSIKAKAEIEDGKWHTHVEVPTSMPADARLWVEIEPTSGQKLTGAFDLNP